MANDGSALKNKLVTVIGGGGFVGRYVVRALIRRGARVRIAQRDPREALFLRTQGGLGQTQFLAVDVTRPDTIARALDGVDGVVNLAGTFGKGMESVQAGGAKAVAAAAAQAGARGLVHLSAIGADAAGDSGYARSKGIGEEAVHAAFPNATILRPSTIFGREDQFVNRFAGMIAKLPIVPVLRAGARFQPVFVGDVADAVAGALGEPGAHAGKTYELGGPDVIAMGELLRWIAQAIERQPIFAELPDALGNLIASAGFLPGAPITRDQWKMLQRDSVAAGEGLAALGVVPTALSAVAPQWLVRFRRHGRFSDGARADSIA